MEIYRKTRNHQSNMSPSPGNGAMDSSSGTQGLATLITMIVVLVIILLFCFWSAPGVRDFCRRSICCYCPMDEPDAREAGTPVDTTSTMPTIILLPFGRMLVVDRSVFAQMETDDTGLDFLELSANIIRAHHQHHNTGHTNTTTRRHYHDSTSTILDSEPSNNTTHYHNNNTTTTAGTITTMSSKGDLSLSPSSGDYLPPAYDDIFGLGGATKGDLPPSYSEVNLLLRQLMANSRTSFSHSALNIVPVGSLSSNTVREAPRHRYSFSTHNVNDSRMLVHYENELSSVYRSERRQRRCLLTNNTDVNNSPATLNNTSVSNNTLDVIDSTDRRHPLSVSDDSVDSSVPAPTGDTVVVNVEGVPQGSIIGATIVPGPERI